MVGFCLWTIEVRPLPTSLAPFVTHSLTRSLTRALAHSLTHSLARSLAHWRTQAIASLSCMRFSMKAFRSSGKADELPKSKNDLMVAAAQEAVA